MGCAGPLDRVRAAVPPLRGSWLGRPKHATIHPLCIGASAPIWERPPLCGGENLRTPDNAVVRRRPTLMWRGCSSLVRSKGESSAGPKGRSYQGRGASPGIKAAWRIEPRSGGTRGPKVHATARLWRPFGAPGGVPRYTRAASSIGAYAPICERPPRCGWGERVAASSVRDGVVFRPFGAPDDEIALSLSGLTPRSGNGRHVVAGRNIRSAVGGGVVCRPEGPFVSRPGRKPRQKGGVNN
jgi:hypothetical protein